LTGCQAYVTGDILRINVLGPLEVVVDDRARTPKTPKIRTVLALLIANPNETVFTEHLIEELWGGKVPRSAAGTVQTYIYQLRRAIQIDEPEIGLVTKPSGYQLRVNPERLDIHQFERLAEQGSAALDAGDLSRASHLLYRALRLWRGPAFGGVECGQRLNAYIVRLEENKLAVLERRIEADLRQGRHRELVGELKALVATHPLHEWLYSRLMLTLYLSGRRCEALEVYQAFRRRLREELGLDPSPELQRLQRALLTGSIPGYGHPRGMQVGAGISTGGEAEPALVVCRPAS